VELGFLVLFLAHLHLIQAEEVAVAMLLLLVETVATVVVVVVDPEHLHKVPAALTVVVMDHPL
jgi:hypothetical protein